MKEIDITAKILAGVGALNLGTDKFLNIDVLSHTSGLVNIAAVIAIAVSGGYILYLLYKKKLG